MKPKRRNLSICREHCEIKKHHTGVKMQLIHNKHATHKLLLGASPLKIRRSEWKCSQECKNKKKLSHFRDSQAVEKHILRHHPDPVYNQFVCIVCDKKNTSPQQILDHIGQTVNVGGHAVRGQTLKNEYLRAINKDTNNLFR
jgi:hypothetical protein